MDTVESATQEARSARGRLSTIAWRGVPESPGPAHAFSADRPEMPALCGAFPHPKDVERHTNQCQTCRATKRRLQALAEAKS